MNNYYFNNGNPIISILVLVLIVALGFWLLGLLAAEVAIPGIIITIVKILLVVYAIFGFLNIIGANR